MNDALRVGIAGLGIGRYHLVGFDKMPDQFETVALCDIDEERLHEVSTSHGIDKTFSNFDDLCRMKDLDVIDICTPSFLHFSQAVQALQAQKHVICEKPIAASLQEIDALQEVEKASGKRLMPIFQHRFGNGVRKLKNLIARDLAGRAYLTTIEVAWLRGADYYSVPWRGKWRTEIGGTLVTHAIHALDTLLHLLGPVRKVCAHITTRVNPIQVEDCAVITVEMVNGSLASISVTVGSEAEISRIRCCFQNFAVESNLQPYLYSSEPWRYSYSNPEIEKKVEAETRRLPGGLEGYEGQFGAFYHAVQDGGELPVTITQARAVAELLTAIYFSSRMEKVEHLPLSNDHPFFTGWGADMEKSHKTFMKEEKS